MDAHVFSGCLRVHFVGAEGQKRDVPSPLGSDGSDQTHAEEAAHVGSLGSALGTEVRVHCMWFYK